MALYFNNVVHLLKARVTGVSFRSTLTLSRLNLFLSPAQARLLAAMIQGTPAEAGRVSLLRHQFGEFADEFLKAALAIDELDSIDLSDYEGASILHDLNLPVSGDLSGRFDAIIDAGTIEHLFNVPVALTNVARMLRVGGSLFLFPPANNMCGHGFHQFSPDFFFRVFSEENGFALQGIHLYRSAALDQYGLGTSRRVYRVADPKISGCHAPLNLPNGPICMLVQARKIRDCAMLFCPPPVQSIYSQTWEDAITGDQRFAGKSSAFLLMRRIWKTMPAAIRLPVTRLRQRWEGCLWNRRVFTPEDFRQGL